MELTETRNEEKEAFREIYDGLDKQITLRNLKRKELDRMQQKLKMRKYRRFLAENGLTDSIMTPVPLGFEDFHFRDKKGFISPNHQHSKSLMNQKPPERAKESFKPNAPRKVSKAHFDVQREMYPEYFDRLSYGLKVDTIMQGHNKGLEFFEPKIKKKKNKKFEIYDQIDKRRQQEKDKISEFRRRRDLQAIQNRNDILRRAVRPHIEISEFGDEENRLKALEIIETLDKAKRDHPSMFDLSPPLSSSKGTKKVSFRLNQPERSLNIFRKSAESLLKNSNKFFQNPMEFKTGSQLLLKNQ